MATEQDPKPAKPELPNLANSPIDRVAALARAGVGMVPIVGSALAEIVTEIVPNQRIDRVVDYIRLLEVRIASMEIDRVAEDLRLPHNIDLIEEGAYKAARTISDDRRDHIASLVSHGISPAAAETLRAKRLLSIYGDLDDGDISLLLTYAGIGSYADLLPRRDAYEDRSYYDRDIALFNSSRNKLERMQLVNARDINPARENNFGSHYAPHIVYNITALGVSLVELIGLEVVSENTLF